MMVSGVRSSWEASAENRLVTWYDSSRRWIMRLSASDRRSTSSPVAGTGRRWLRLRSVILLGGADDLVHGTQGAAEQVIGADDVRPMKTGKPSASVHIRPPRALEMSFSDAPTSTM